MGEKKDTLVLTTFSIQVKWKICPRVLAHPLSFWQMTHSVSTEYKELRSGIQRDERMWRTGVSLSLVGIVIITYNLSSCKLQMKIKLESEELILVFLCPRMADSDGSFRCRWVKVCVSNSCCALLLFFRWAETSWLARVETAQSTNNLDGWRSLKYTATPDNFLAYLGIYLLRTSKSFISPTFENGAFLLHPEIPLGWTDDHFGGRRWGGEQHLIKMYWMEQILYRYKFNS